MVKPKLLLITYYWPPAGGAGVQRWLTMTSYLAKDFDITVFCPQDAAYPITDDSLQKYIHPEIKVVKKSIFEPQNWLKKLGIAQEASKGNMAVDSQSSAISKLAIWIRANLFIPDARKFWVTPSIKKLQVELEKNPHDFMISTGPPHSTHLIAAALKKKFPGIRWISDWRDPWTEIDYFSNLPLTTFSHSRHLKLEQEVLQTADALVSVSPSWAKDMMAKSGRDVRVIYNGFDARHFQDIDVKPPQKFSLLYVGSLNNDRNRSPLWQALEDILNENPAFEQAFELELVGTIAPITRDQITQLPKLFQKTRFQHYIEHSQVAQKLSDAAVLLLLINDTANAQGIIPAKVFEYMASQRPVLGIGLQNSDIAHLLQQNKAGEIFDIMQIQDIKQFLLQKFHDYQQNQLLGANPESIHAYTRESAANQYADLLRYLAAPLHNQ